MDALLRSIEGTPVPGETESERFKRIDNNLIAIVTAMKQYYGDK